LQKKNPQEFPTDLSVDCFLQESLADFYEKDNPQQILMDFYAKLFF